MSHRKVSGKDGERIRPWEEIVLGLIGDLLTFLLHTTRANPADPAATDALRRIDATRRQLQSESGAEVTPISDPHGLLGLQSDKPEGK